MLDRESSLRLSLLRFPLIVGVVFVHAYSTTAGFSGGEVGVSQPSIIADFVRNFISQGVARIAVPLFFLMSGYLFFFGFEWSKEHYAVKLRSRTKTLLVPFLFWNIATLLVFAAAQANPATKIFFSGNSSLIANFGLFEFFDAVFGLTRNPIAYQFWFIRDLFIVILLVPLIRLLIKFLPLLYLGIMAFFWVVGLWETFIPSMESLLFFSVGAFLGATKRNLFHFDSYGKIALIIYLAVVAIGTLTGNLFIYKIGILLGMQGGLYATKLLAENDKLKLLIARLGMASFFVYAVHEPLLTIIKKVAYRVLQPDSSVVILMLYFLIPTITIVIAVAGYWYLRKLAPGFVNIVTGGR
jgi:surface polysaccharide O-acyltransferase-like enzyme